MPRLALGSTRPVRRGRRWTWIAGASLLVLACGAPALAQPPDGTWAPVAPPQIEPRLFACDSLRDQDLFQTRMGTIWSVTPGNPATWAVVDPNAPPGEPFYDPIRDRLIVIGRTAASTLVATRNRSVASWDSVRIAGVPALVNTSRLPGAMVFDAPRNRVVMFGTVDVPDGFPQFTQYSNEVWVLDLGGAPHWTQLLPTGTPPTGRHDAAVIFDPVRVQLVLFGGDDQGVQLPQDTWALTLAGSPAWVPIGQAGVLPPGRVQAGVVYDPLADQMMIFAGSDRSGSSNNDGFWVLPLAAPTQWTPLAVDLLDIAGQRSPRMVFDPRRGNTVIAGVSNENGSSRSATSGWTLTYYPQIPAWLVAKQYSWPDQPPLWAREYAAAAYDGMRSRLLVFGGSHINNGTTGVRDSWAETLSSGAWTPFDVIMPSGVPPLTNQLYGNMVFDRPRDRIVMVETPPGFQVKTYVMDVSNAPSGGFTPVNAGGVLPFGRDYPSFVYDPVHDRVLMFGGHNAGGYSNELWQLSLGGTPTWTLLTPSGTPPAGRDHAAAVYDSIGNRLVVHGGIIFASPGVTTDTWTCSFAGAPAWQPLSPAGAPPNPVFGNETNVTAIYDAIRQRMVVTAPETLGTRQGAWALSLGPTPAWTHLDLAGPPPSARAAVAAAYDMRRDALVMFGGRSVGLRWPDLNDTWFLDFAAPVVPDVACPGSMVWVAGSPANFSVGVTPVAEQTADYTLTSQRAWPGFPMTGSIDLHVGTPTNVLFSVPVPDSASPGLNALVFRITPRGAAASAACSFHLHDATTPTAGIFVSALVAPGQIRLHWDAPGAVACTLERRTVQDEWRTLASVSRGMDGAYAYVDANVIPGGRYGYRVTPNGGAPSLETWVDVPGGLKLALAGLQPNPAGGPVTVAFTLPDAQPARLELVDVAGRRVVNRSLAGLGAGAHVLRIEDAHALPAGVYFVRLIHGRDVMTTRGAIVR